MLKGIDPSLFPVLKTRRALIVVDVQNDFLSSDGPLLIDVPDNLTGRIVRLVKGFRPYGDIVWIRSEYNQPRPARSEQIIISDAPKDSRRPPPSRGRKQPIGVDQIPSRCPEAFLSGPAPGRPECVRKGTKGAEPPDAIQELVDKKDMSFVKTYYSAFQIPDLIQRLRMKFVSEVFICGSLSNIGVMSTAIDAGSHGLDIGIIEDCCGRRDEVRHAAALARIQETTGCEFLSTDKILERLKPKPKLQRQLAALIPPPTGMRYPSVYDAPSGATNEPEQVKEREESTCSTISASRMNSEAPIAKTILPDQAESELPPITFTRARVAVRGRPARTLLDVEERFADQLKSPDAIYDNVERSLYNDNESSNERSNMILNSAQSQATIGARSQEKANEGTRSSFDSSAMTSENGLVTAIRSSLKLDHGEKADAIESQRSAFKTSDTPEKASTGIKPKFSSGETTTVRSTLDYTQPLPESMNSRENVTREASDKSVEESEPLCEGDTRVLYNVLPHPLSDNIFKKVEDEVEWQRMSHQGGEVPRLVAVQGEVDGEGNIPIYRHPADESPPLLQWTPTVKDIKEVVERKVGHPLNHALIQYYRDGTDYISEHSDKTLDIVKGSFIVNVSLGAERTMTLRTKRQPKLKDAPQSQSAIEGAKREVQRARLPHNSMCKMGLQTNMRWLHAIKQDRRLDRDKTEDELAYGGARISLTFRQIGTFLDREQKVIWGQGAKAKTMETAHEVVNGQTPEAVKMLQAFGRENQSTEFNWEESYGLGFDVLHVSAAARLFSSSDPIANLRAQFMLTEMGIGHAKGSLAPVSTRRERQERRSGDPLVKLVDNDKSKTTVRGDVAIMLYLDRFYGRHHQESSEKSNVACTFERFQEAVALDPHGDLKATCLDSWEVYAGQAEYIAGGTSPSIADFAFWPVLHELVQSSNGNRAALEKLPNLRAYYSRIRTRETVVKVIGKEREGPGPDLSEMTSPAT